jgi:transcriptional regulator NrdR family protein
MEERLQPEQLKTICRHKKNYSYKVLHSNIDKSGKYVKYLLKCSLCKKVFTYYFNQQLKVTKVVNV